MENPNIEASPGQILWGLNNRNRRNKTVHPMIYISPVQDQPHLFIGVIVTSNPNYNNKAIPDKYFQRANEEGVKYEFPSLSTYIRPRNHFKFVDWQPFMVIGQLSDEGLTLVKKLTEGQDPTFYEFNKI